MNEMLAKKASDFAGEKQHSGVAPLPGGGLIL